MNWKMIWRIIAYTLLIEAVLMVPALAISFGYQEMTVVYAYLASIAVIIVVAGVLLLVTKNSRKGFYARDGLVTAGLTWLAMSMLGCLPFWFSREIPSYVDCLFEMVSGFTTTGSSILTDVEAMSKGLLWWRSFSHWVGGMGVLVFLMAIVPLGGKNSGFTLHILRAESPGPSVGKMTPRMKKTASILYKIYFGLTVINIVLLLAGGMDWFEACCHAFGTAGTGGFGIKADSFASYSPYLQNVTTIFMLLFSVNFTIYYLLLLRKFTDVIRDEELRAFVLIVLGSIIALVFCVRPLYGTLEETIRHSAFTVGTIISTTGYATTDFNLWPAFAKAVVLILMCIGACAGSTGGGIKVIRVVLLGKIFRRNLHQSQHPDEVSAIRINGKRIDEQVVRNTTAYLIIYVAIAVISFLLVSLDGFDVETNLSAVLSTFNNIGPGLGAVGPVSNFASYSDFSKLVMTFDMLAGRLEIYPIIVILSHRTWARTR